MEKYANELVETVFRESVCSEGVLRLQVFVENAYENCVAPNDANLDTFSMMKWIEKTHEELNMQLDTLPPEVVHACETEGFKQELYAMKETEEAAKKVSETDNCIANATVYLYIRVSNYESELRLLITLRLRKRIVPRK